MTRPLALAAGLLVLSACGAHAPTPAPPPAPAPPAPPTAAAEPPAPPPDLSPVERPSRLRLLGRLAHPAVLLRTAATWAQRPVPSATDVARLVTDELGGKLLDLDAAIDLAATSDGWAVSLAVTSMDDARASLPSRSKLVAGSNGALRIDGLFDLEDYDGSARRLHTCELAPSAGPAGTRLVCASNAATLEVLAPYLTRTIARAPTEGDVHVEARLDHEAAEDERRTIPLLLKDFTDSSDPAWTAIVERLTGEIVYLETDVDALTLDGKLADGALQLDMKVTFAVARSQTARMLVSHPERVDAPPAAFWRLPVDADVALFDRGIDDERIEHARDMVLRLLSDALDREKLGEADRRALTAALSHLLTTPSPAVFAHGVDFAAAKSAVDLAAGAAGGNHDAVTQRARAATLGWWIEGLQEPAARVQAAMAELVRAWNRPTLQAWAHADSSQPPVVALEPVPAASKLPRGTTHATLSSASDGFSLHLYAVPDGQRVWLAMGMDPRTLVDELHDVLGAPARTLAARPGLEPLKAMRSSSGGFVTARGLWTSWPGVLGNASNRAARDHYASVARLPDRGATPTLVTWSSDVPSNYGPAGSLLATARIDKDAIAALAQLQGIGLGRATTRAKRDLIGVTECDDYIATWEACYQDPAMRRAAQPGLDQMEKAWKTAARTAEGRAGLAAGCKMALDNFPRAACK